MRWRKDKLKALWCSILILLCSFRSACGVWLSKMIPILSPAGYLLSINLRNLTKSLLLWDSLTSGIASPVSRSRWLLKGIPFQNVYTRNHAWWLILLPYEGWGFVLAGCFGCLDTGFVIIRNRMNNFLSLSKRYEFTCFIKTKPHALHHHIFPPNTGNPPCSP